MSAFWPIVPESLRLDIVGTDFVSETERFSWERLTTQMSNSIAKDFKVLVITSSSKFRLLPLPDTLTSCRWSTTNSFTRLLVDACRAFKLSVSGFAVASSSSSKRQFRESAHRVENVLVLLCFARENVRDPSYVHTRTRGYQPLGHFNFPHFH